MDLAGVANGPAGAASGNDMAAGVSAGENVPENPGAPNDEEASDRRKGRSLGPSGLEIALVEPEIPQNTGNIGRTCVAAGVRLNLVKPLGFSLEDRYLKRAGLDYWPHLELAVHECLDDFMASMNGRRLILTRSSGGRRIYDFRFRPGDVIVFGRESTGLPPDVFSGCDCVDVTIPMVGKTRSLNLSNSVAVVLFEALRQMSVAGLGVFEPLPGCVQAEREALAPVTSPFRACRNEGDGPE